jgi:hypothetical protein
MHPFEYFVHISTGPPPGLESSSADDGVASDFYQNAQGKRWSTEALLTDSIRRKHPKHHLTITPTYVVNLVGWANATADVTCVPHGKAEDNMSVRLYYPPARRYNDDNGGTFVQQIHFGCYDFVFKGQQFLVYVAEGSEGAMYKSAFTYILVEDLTELAQKKTDELITAAGNWGQELHDEVLVFDQGFWQKNKELWQNVQKSSWDDVILDKEKKEALTGDILGFFDAQKKYEEFGVPWKVFNSRWRCVCTANLVLERCHFLWAPRCESCKPLSSFSS